MEPNAAETTMVGAKSRNSHARVFDATQKALLGPKAQTFYTIASVHIKARVGMPSRIPLWLPTVSLKIQGRRSFFSIPRLSLSESAKENVFCTMCVSE